MSYILKISPALLAGLLETIKIFLLTLVLSLPLGLVLSILGLSKNRFISKLIKLYILIMRGTPLMLQLVFIFFGLPIININLDRFTAAIIAFVFNYAAYFAEIFRGGINSIDKGQYEACKVLGFNKLLMYRRIIIPQVTKIVLPSISNEVISLVKDTSLVYVVGIGELLRAGKIASNRDVTLLPLFIVGIIYLSLTNLITKFLNKLEMSFSYYD